MTGAEEEETQKKRESTGRRVSGGQVAEVDGRRHGIAPPITPLKRRHFPHRTQHKEYQQQPPPSIKGRVVRSLSPSSCRSFVGKLVTRPATQTAASSQLPSPMAEGS
mmetsp:Transcript_2635/g.7690  ORF Transcript_2635/g.7690 Transcript_2635/m.7690 type:complete len:107 (+) Transcript_2635:85-405(+)